MDNQLSDLAQADKARFLQEREELGARDKNRSGPAAAGPFKAQEVAFPSFYWPELNSRLMACEDYLISNEPMKAYRELLHAREVCDKAQAQIRIL